MCADFWNLGKEIEMLEAAGADLIHFDVNDGVFTPIITMGEVVLSALRGKTGLPFEVHLQISEPARHIDSFIDAGANIIIIHVEACIDLFRIVKKIKDRGVKAGLSLNPITPLSYLEYILDDLDTVLIMTIDAGLLGQSFIPQTLEKIKNTRQMISKRGLSVDIAVDGAINRSTIPDVVKAGANVLALGSSSGLFGLNADRVLILNELRQLAEENI
jgi:ribulose-phosphate 3-epimerase